MESKKLKNYQRNKKTRRIVRNMAEWKGFLYYLIKFFEGPGTRYTQVLEVVVRRADANPEKILNEFLEWDTAI